MDFESELMLDAQEDAKVVSYVKEHMPKEITFEYTDEDLYYILDVTEEYFAESGVLDGKADADGYVDVNLSEAAAYVVGRAHEECNLSYPQEFVEAAIELQLTYGEDEG